MEVYTPLEAFCSHIASTLLKRSCCALVEANPLDIPEQRARVLMRTNSNLSALISPWWVGAETDSRHHYIRFVEFLAECRKICVADSLQFKLELSGPRVEVFPVHIFCVSAEQHLGTWYATNNAELYKLLNWQAGRIAQSSKFLPKHICKLSIAIEKRKISSLAAGYSMPISHFKLRSGQMEFVLGYQKFTGRIFAVLEKFTMENALVGIPLELGLGSIELSEEQLLQLRPGSELEIDLPESMIGYLRVGGVIWAECQARLSLGRAVLAISSLSAFPEIGAPSPQESLPSVVR